MQKLEGKIQEVNLNLKFLNVVILDPPPQFSLTFFFYPFKNNDEDVVTNK